MNILVNPKDHVVMHTNPKAPEGFVVIETVHGYHYISDEQVFFLPKTEAEELLKKDIVRNIFGIDE